MWDRKKIQVNSLTKRKQTTDLGESRRGGLHSEFEVSRHKLLNAKYRNSEPYCVSRETVPYDKRQWERI